MRLNTVAFLSLSFSVCLCLRMIPFCWSREETSLEGRNESVRCYLIRGMRELMTFSISVEFVVERKDESHQVNWSVMMKWRMSFEICLENFFVKKNHHLSLSLVVCWMFPRGECFFVARRLNLHISVRWRRECFCYLPWISVKRLVLCLCREFELNVATRKSIVRW